MFLSFINKFDNFEIRLNTSLEKALDLVYTSKTIELLQIEDAELYVQSSAYVYEMLIKELGLYPVFDNDNPAMVAEDPFSY